MCIGKSAIQMHFTFFTAVFVLFVRYNMMLESDWIVVVDTVSVSDSSQGKRYNTLQIHPHPQFSASNNDYDLCLLRTQTMEMGGMFARACVQIQLQK